MMAAAVEANEPVHRGTEGLTTCSTHTTAIPVPSPKPVRARRTIEISSATRDRSTRGNLVEQQQARPGGQSTRQFEAFTTEQAELARRAVDVAGQAGVLEDAEGVLVGGPAAQTSRPPGRQ